MKTYKTDGQNRVIFSKDMKVAELVDADFSLLSILLRMDMQLPFGDLSVEELCRRYGISVELFLMICQVYSTADYLPDVESLKADDLKYVIITCNPDNYQSRKTCEYAGGKLLEIVEVPEGNDMRERGETEKCIYKFVL